MGCFFRRKRRAGRAQVRRVRVEGSGVRRVPSTSRELLSQTTEVRGLLGVRMIQ